MTTVINYVGTDGQTHWRPRVSDRDETPNYHGAYDRRCWGCWNGNAHSEAYHIYAVSRSEEGRL